MASGFGERLRVWRETDGISQKTLASRVGLSPSMIALLELGERRPTREHVKALAKALALSSPAADELLLAAEQLPLAYDRVSPGDPDLVLLADILGDPAIGVTDKNRVRLSLRLACAPNRPGISLSTLAKHLEGITTESDA